jgi:ribosomal protein L40E
VARKTIGYIQLEWVCPNCSTRNPGPKKTCLNCGAPQPENVKFERPADEKLVEDQASIQAARAGADYICPYCETRNGARAKVCVQCGGDLVEARRRATGAELVANAGPTQITCSNCATQNPANRSNCLKCGSPLARESSPVQPAAAARSNVAQPRKRSKWLLWGAIGAAVAICAVALTLFVFPSSAVDATVADVSWESIVPVQEIRSVQYSNESGSPPSGAYDVSCRTESRDVCEEKVVDQGNGFAEVVQDCHTESKEYCSYTIDEWETVQTYTLEGHDLAPVYSQPAITAGQRIGDQTADYSVIFETAKGQKSYSPPNLAEFERFRISSSWSLSLNAFGAILDVK